MRAISGAPIKFTGVGEKVEALRLVAVLVCGVIGADSAQAQEAKHAHSRTHAWGALSHVCVCVCAGSGLCRLIVACLPQGRAHNGGEDFYILSRILCSLMESIFSNLIYH